MSLSFSWFVPRIFFIVLFSFNLNNNKHVLVQGQQQGDPSTMNGGSVLAMAGKDCVALAVDKRFGSGPSLININTQPDAKVLVLPASHDTLVMVSCTGLEGDVQSLQQDLKNIVATKYNYNYQAQQQQRGTFLSPRSMASLTSHVLYNRRQAPYYVEPIIIGLERRQQQQQVASDDSTSNNESEKSLDEILITAEQEARTTTSIATTTSDDDTAAAAAAGRRYYYRYHPYLCSLDMIGAKSVSRAFCCSGAASQSLYGTAEALWRPNLTEEQLVQTCARAFTTALERDCLSGYGAVVYLVSPSRGIVAYDISSRND